MWDSYLKSRERNRLKIMHVAESFPPFEREGVYTAMVVEEVHLVVKEGRCVCASVSVRPRGGQGPVR